MPVKYILPKEDPSDEFILLRGNHAVHPILPDDTLCGIAISDNREGFDFEQTSAKVSCLSCLKIIKFCKSIK